MAKNKDSIYYKCNKTAFPRQYFYLKEYSVFKYTWSEMLRTQISANRFFISIFVLESSVLEALYGN